MISQIELNKSRSKKYGVKVICDNVIYTISKSKDYLQDLYYLIL